LNVAWHAWRAAAPLHSVLSSGPCVAVSLGNSRYSGYFDSFAQFSQ